MIRDEQKTFLTKGYVNPLYFPLPEDRSKHETIAINFFDFVLQEGNRSKRLKHFIERHDKVSGVSQKLKFIPSTSDITEKIIFPLKHAYADFLVGNFLGTIALSGMISEMIAILQFELNRFQIQGRDMTEADQAKLFGSKFEKLGQERRIKILEAYGVISNKLYEGMIEIKDVRRKYLHFWSHSHSNLEEDSLRVLSSAVDITMETFLQEFEDGGIKMKPELISYIIREADEASS